VGKAESLWAYLRRDLLAFGSGVSPLISGVAAAIFGLGLVWLGYALWSNQGIIEEKSL